MSTSAATRALAIAPRRLRRCPAPPNGVVATTARSTLSGGASAATYATTATTAPSAAAAAARGGRRRAAVPARAPAALRRRAGAGGGGGGGRRWSSSAPGPTGRPSLPTSGNNAPRMRRPGGVTAAGDGGSARRSHSISTGGAAPPVRHRSARAVPAAETESAPSSASSIGDALHSVRERVRAFLLQPRTATVPRWITPRRFSFTLTESFGHGSFILVAASYATDDFMVLRCVAVAGSASMLFFTYFHPHGRVLWLPFKWNVLFIAINSYRIGRVLYGRYMAGNLPDDMLRLRSKHFYALDPIDFAKLVRLGRTETYKAGDLIAAQHTPNRYIRLIIEGEVEVMRDNVLTYMMEEANFISESGLHAGLQLTGKVDSCGSIVARRVDSSGRPCGTIRLLAWDRDELMDLLRREPSLLRGLKAALSWDIVRKLKMQRIMLAEGLVKDPEKWTRKRNEQGEHRYAAILQSMLQRPKDLPAYRDELNKYRIIHHIVDDRHRAALEKCGWTPEDFDLGRRARSLEDEDEDEDDHGGMNKWQSWKGTANSLLARVLP